MSTRYEDRDYDRDEQDFSGGRRSSEYGRSYGGRSQGNRYDDGETYGRSRFGREYGGRYSSGDDRERGRYSGQRSQGNFSESGDRYSGDSGYGEYGERYSSGRQNEGRYSSSRSPEMGGDYTGRYSSTRGMYGDEGYDEDRWRNDRGYSSVRDRSYGNYDRSYGETRYGQGSYSQGYNYPGGSTRENYRNRNWTGYDRGQYGRGQGQDYADERGERGWWDRTSDEVASWFGDKEAEQRRQMDRQQQFRGRGPKGYRRSDERIKEDVNDRLSAGYLDAREIEVAVAENEVVLTGSVNSRGDKRMAEDIAESVSGVTNVENRLRVTQSSLDRPPLGAQTTGTSPTTGTSGSTGTTGSSGSTSGTSTSAATATGRGRSAGT